MVVFEVVSHPFMVFSITCVLLSPILFWGVCYVTLMNNKFTISVISWISAFKCAYYYLGTSKLDSVMRCMLMLHNGLQVDQSVHKWNLSLVCSRISSPCILKCKIVVWSGPMCYASCHDVNNLHRKKLLLLTNNIILAMSGRETLRPLAI